jgi:hypothetical protein
VGIETPNIIMPHIVYEISGPNSTSVYIGYCPQDAVEPIAHFLVGATRKEDRGDVRFLADHGNDATALRHTVIDKVDSEVEAFDLRNTARATNPFSFTGPSRWPEGAYERSRKDNPSKYEASEKLWKARQMKTARDAYAAGLWTAAQIKGLTAHHDRADVVADLDLLTPNDFGVKYANHLK